MTAPLAGVRVVEVATHVFVPMAGAVLAEWGARRTVAAGAASGLRGRRRRAHDRRAVGTAPYRRATSGEPSVIDASLLASGMWQVQPTS